MTRPLILVDCDSVLSDIVTSAVEAVNKKLDTKFTNDDVLYYEIFSSLGEVAQRAWEETIQNDKFCLNMKPLPGAREAITELQTFADVYCITAPHPCSPWMHEREQWLLEQMNISRHNIGMFHAKHLVYGDMFIDDTSFQVKNWAAAHPDKTAVLFKTRFVEQIPGVLWTDDWNVIIQKARELIK